MLADSYTKALRRYDKDLYAGRTMDGALCVFRKVKSFDLVLDEAGFKLYNLVTKVQFIFALTDNWLRSGVPRQWGIDQVVGRVRQIDTLANERFFEEMDAQNEAVDQAEKRKMRNEIENFWIDGRKAFQKATDDILIHSLSKDEPRKRLKDRSIKNGNY